MADRSLQNDAGIDAQILGYAANCVLMDVLSPIEDVVEMGSSHAEFAAGAADIEAPVALHPLLE